MPRHLKANPKIDGRIVQKIVALLPIKYSVREMSEELSVPNRTLRNWISNYGIPFSKDSRNHIWINGYEFANWAKTNLSKKKIRMKDNHAFCFRCRKPVELINPKIVPIKAKLINIRAKCPKCGVTINRGGRSVG